jgi:hypothetical protein
VDKHWHASASMAPCFHWAPTGTAWLDLPAGHQSCALLGRAVHLLWTSLLSSVSFSSPLMRPGSFLASASTCPARVHCTTATDPLPRCIGSAALVQVPQSHLISSLSSILTFNHPVFGSLATASFLKACSFDCPSLCLLPVLRPRSSAPRNLAANGFSRTTTACQCPPHPTSPCPSSRPNPPRGRSGTTTTTRTVPTTRSSPSTSSCPARTSMPPSSSIISPAM